MIKDAHPFGCLPPDDPSQQLASPSTERWDIVRNSKFSHALESQTSDIWVIGITPHCVVHPAVRQRTLRSCIAPMEFRYGRIFDDPALNSGGLRITVFTEAAHSCFVEPKVI